jgi:hypothetical protein
MQVKISAPTVIDVCTTEIILDANASTGADGRRLSFIIILILFVIQLVEGEEHIL